MEINLTFDDVADRVADAIDAAAGEHGGGMGAAIEALGASPERAEFDRTVVLLALSYGVRNGLFGFGEAATLVHVSATLAETPVLKAVLDNWYQEISNGDDE